ncbi:hypothetical protein EMCRGX_G002540 [Ephydatia muelleri]
MARRHEEGRKTSTPKNSITDAPASFREELRLLKERIVHLETIVDKIDELEEKIEELIKREPAVLDSNLEPSLSATGRPVEGAKDVVPLMILQDAFSQQPRLKELMTTTPWSKLDSQSKEQLATSVEAALRYNKCKIPTNKRILQRIKAYYAMRRTSELAKADPVKLHERKLCMKRSRLTYVARDKAVKEAISKGTVQSGDMESMIKIRDSVKPIPLDNLTIEVADHEDGASKVRRLELRLERQDGYNIMCVHATQMQLIRMLKKHVVLQAEISIPLNPKYKKVHLLAVKIISLQDQM